MLLAYDDQGPGPVVVLLHGFPLDHTMWAYQIADIGRSYRIIAPDLRGHGRSAAPDGIYLIDDMADDVIELLDALQLRAPVVLGGLSMGGYVALSLIARYPDRFRALMLMDTKASADSPEAVAYREVLAKQVEEGKSVSPVVRAMMPRLFSPKVEAHQETPTGVLEAILAKLPTKRNVHHVDAMSLIQKIMEETPVRAVAGALRGMAIRPDRTPDLANIRVPTLVLVGADDVMSPPDEARAMAALIPGATLSIIPGAGHLAPFENPIATNLAIHDFLRTLA